MRDLPGPGEVHHDPAVPPPLRLPGLPAAPPPAAARHLPHLPQGRQADHQGLPLTRQRRKPLSKKGLVGLFPFETHMFMNSIQTTW